MVVIVVTWLLGSMAARGVKKTRDPSALPPGEDAERTRRVREEVQRKIVERRREAAARPGSWAESPSATPRPAERSQPPLAPPVAASRPAPPADEEDVAEAALQRQQKLAEQVRAMEAARTAAQVRTSALAAFAPPGASPGSPPIDWLPELRDPRSVRRAVILREILGPPVALR